ncbi:MAG: NfeD family protein [Bacteroidales bacterium]
MGVILLLIGLGILLFVIEFLLVPGVTVAGIGGLVLTVYGVYRSFALFGAGTGTWVLVGTLVVSALVIALSLRARTWKRLMLDTNIEGNVQSSQDGQPLARGDRGEALTRLAPMGKILVNGIVREGVSITGYVKEHTPVEIVSVEGSRISVKPIND